MYFTMIDVCEFNKKLECVQRAVLIAETVFIREKKLDLKFCAKCRHYESLNS